MSKNKTSFFWASYADLMTSLFFIMLVLFVITILMMKKQANEIQKKAQATEEQYKKITEIEESVKKIDTKYFTYSEEHKKHILNINVEFETGSADMNNIPFSTQFELIKAGQSIKTLVDSAKYIGAKYLLVIEGQSSKDNYYRNDELSYRRALALKVFWINRGVVFDKQYCELLVSGSGQSGLYRVTPDNATNKANQRFLIHIIPKPGIAVKNEYEMPKYQKND